jgi:ABC-type polysaccharide/polyol phosphate export permease
MTHPTPQVILPPKESVIAGLFGGFVDIWRTRGLLYELTLRDIRVRYKQAVMGFAWAIFMPLLIVLSGLLIRVALMSSTGNGFDRAILLALLVKGLGWGFFAGAIGFATSSLVASGALVSRIYFPRAVMPISATLAQGADTTIALLVVMLGIPWLGITFSWALLWLPVMAVLLVAFTLAVGLVASSANVFFRDVKYIIQVFITFGIFFTPIFYEPAMFGPQGARIIMWNPLSSYLEGMRLAVAEGHNLLEPLLVATDKGTVVAWELSYLVYGAVWALGGLTLAMVIFRRAERILAEYV